MIDSVLINFGLILAVITANYRDLLARKKMDKIFAASSGLLMFISLVVKFG